jgi:hypothetical protein
MYIDPHEKVGHEHRCRLAGIGVSAGITWYVVRQLNTTLSALMDFQSPISTKDSLTPREELKLK